MTDRDGDATIHEYIRKAKVERHQDKLKEAEEAERRYADEEARAKALADRQTLELRQRLRSKGPLLARALGLRS